MVSVLSAVVRECSGMKVMCILVSPLTSEGTGFGKREPDICDRYLTVSDLVEKYT